MRYYDISVTDPKGGKQLLHYTSHPRGVDSPPDPGALQVELDLFLLYQGQADANSLIRVWGIPLSVLSSGSNFNLMNCAVRGGMGRGLPLANPNQSGPLVSGQIIQAFGNWVGTEMTLDLILQPGFVPEQKTSEPRNFVVNWPANQPMKSMLEQTLRTALPGLKRSIEISDDLKLPNTEAGFYATLPQFAQYVKNLSRKIKGAKSYAGVEILVNGNTVTAQDGTKEKSVREISPNDLVGQPTWIATSTIQATLVMRGDISPGDYVKLPEGLLNTRPSSLSTFSPLRARSAFAGKFQVQAVRHVGSFRQADGRAWTTILDCLSTPEKNLNSTDLGPGYGVQTGPGAA